MKKKIVIILLIILMLLIGTRFIPFRTNNLIMSHSSTILEVPKLSTLKEECGIVTTNS